MSFKYEMERTMKIINNIEIDNPNQWIERFVEQVLENKDFKDDHLSNYFFRTTDEKAVKSSSALLRDQDGDVIGMLCINMDITMLQNVNTMLMNYLKTDLEAGRNPGTV